MSLSPILCRLCHSSEATVVRDTLRYGIKRKVLQCRECAFVYLEPSQASSAEFYSKKTYRETYGPNLKKTADCEEIFQTYLPFQNYIIDEIAAILHPNMAVLDVGCSTGHFLTALKEKVGKRVGMEFNQDEVAFIRERLDFPVYSEPIGTTHISEGPFDLVTALQVVEHVEDPVSFLQQLGTQMKPDGYLYIELPNLHDILLDYYQVQGYADFYFREPHLSYFTKDTLHRAATSAGFVGTIKTVQRYNIMNHLHWVMTGAPQDNFVAGNAPAVLVPASNTIAPSDRAGAEEFNRFIQMVDAQYKQLIAKHGLGESLTFLGRLKK